MRALATEARMSLWGRSLIFLLAHAAVALLFLLNREPGTAAALVGFPLDDAWIHMVYARSLAALDGFAYNPGLQEAGATSPLWAVVLVPASLVARVLGISVALPAKLTGILVAAAGSLAAAGLARALGLGLAVELAAGLAIAVDPGLAFAQVSGMEVMLAGGLAAFALGQLALGRHKTAGLAAGLAVLARPEMALLAALVLGFAEWRLQKRRAPLRERLWVLAPAVVLVLAWLGFCLTVTGHPLPNTVYAKLASRQEYLSHNLTVVFGQLMPQSPWFARGAGMVLWAVGAIAMFRRGWAAGLVAAFPILFLLGVAGSQLLREIDAFYWQRYVLPAQVFVLLTLAVGAAQAVAWAWRRRRLNWGIASVVGVALLLSGSVVDLPSALAKRARLYAWNCQNIEELNVAMATWLRDNIPAHETIAVNDAGAARYFGRHRVLDLMGLNHHGLLHREPEALGELGRVGVLSVFPSWFPSVANRSSFTAIHRTATANLTICRCPQSEIVAYQRDPSGP